MRPTMLFLALLLAPAPAEQAPPSIVFVLVDDLGWRDVGFNGSTYYRTPAIDALAAAGIVFTDAYSAGPNCAPSRASLMSGQYTPRHGVLTVGGTQRGPKGAMRWRTPPTRTTLSPAVETLAEVLQRAGYATAHLGKWHLGHAGETDGPCGQGFDVNIGGTHRGGPYAGGYLAPYAYPGCESEARGEYLTDRLTDEALEFITAHRDEPFFLHLAHYAVHTPLQAKPDLIERYRIVPEAARQGKPVYAAMIESVDESVARIVARLRELELHERTVIVFTSDNGGYSGATSCAPRRGWKGQLYEGGIRVPTCVTWPGTIAAGRVSSEPTTGVDWFPTLAEIAGAELPAAQLVDGESLLPILTSVEGRLEREAIFWHFPCYLAGKTGEHDPWPKGIRQAPAAAIRKGRWKLIELLGSGAVELYDLESDPGELRNRAVEEPERVEELTATLHAWQKQVGAVTVLEELER